MDPHNPDEGVLEFAQLMRRLRAECAWKNGQTHLSLVRYLQEEAAEVIEAIETADSEGLKEELGDLLLQVFLHAAIAEEEGTFTLAEVAAGVSAKMIRRNPHVFAPTADSAGLSADEINARWEEIKRAEKDASANRSVGHLPASLPALLLAQKVLDRLAENAEDVDPGEGEVSSEEIGHELLSVVRRAQRHGIDAEQALRNAVREVTQTGAYPEISLS